MNNCFKILLITALLLGCQKKRKPKEFSFPKITTEFPDSIPSHYKSPDGINETFPRFIGKYKFCDSIQIRHRQDSFTIKDFIEIETYEILDSFNANGIDILVDYNKTVKYDPYDYIEPALSNYYPVYLINNTSENKVIPGKDGYVFGIQEAKKKHYWSAIESRGFDFCGHGKWLLTLRPQEFALILMHKYSGDFTTDLRVRLKLGENILVSKTFKGSIDKRQFLLNDSSYSSELLRSGRHENIEFQLFYGANYQIEK